MADFPTMIVLAGGLATRLGSLVAEKPKAMIEVAGEPFIAHQLRLLRREGVSRVVICVGHLSREIETFVADGRVFGLDVAYSYDGPQLLGTGGAARKAFPFVDDVFGIIYGDTFLDVAFKPIYEAFLHHDKPALMTVLANNNSWDKSNAAFSNDSVRYSKREPTPDMKFIDYGLSIMSKSVFAEHAEGARFDLSDLFESLSHHGLLAGYEVHQRFYEIGSVSGLAETEQYLCARVRT